MVHCCVLTCKSDSGRKIDGVTFHSFPNDSTRRAQWIAATKRIDWNPTKYSRMCSNHFDKKFIIKKNLKTFLTRTAIPNLVSLPAVRSESASTSSQPMDANILTQCPTLDALNVSLPAVRSESASTSSQPMDANILTQCPTLDALNVSLPAVRSESASTSSQPMDANILTRCPTLDALNKNPATPRKLKKKLKLSQELSNMRLKKLKALREKSRRLTKKVANLEDIVTELKMKSLINEEDGDLLNSVEVENKDFLKRFLNPGIAGKKYSPALRKFALCLHFISPRAYKYVRQQFNSCLPHPNTLSNWYRSIDGSPGFTTESLKCLKLLASRDPKPLFCALCIDEIAIRKHVQWDGKKCVGLVNFGETLDGHSVAIAREALVFMATSINGSWKIPLGYFLVDSCTGDQKASLVKQCLDLISSCNINVLSLTFDGCPANFAMAKKLNCSLEGPNSTTYFNFQGRDVVLFPDPAHMLKLVRNTLGEKKVLTNAKGETISWEFIEKLHNLQENEGLHFANKLRGQHINFSKQIMKVKLAAQTFSNSVADAIEYINKKLFIPDFVGSEATVDFLRRFNDLFDVLNSRNFNNAFGFKKPINENNFVAINSFLSEMITYISGLQLQGRPILESSRKVGFLGFVVCIKSVRKIYEDVVLSKTLKFIPVYKLSQDHLEYFFSSIRARGGYNNNPTARQFESAYKRLVLHGEIKNLTSGNCIPLEDINILIYSNVKGGEKNNLILKTNDNDAYELDEKSTENISLTVAVDCDHDYLADPSRLTMYAKEVITYIGGFVVRKLRKCIKCEDCLLALVTDKYQSIIFKKDKGGLIYPSEDVIKICQISERLFRARSQKGLEFFNDKNIMPKLLLASLKECTGTSIFSNDHFNNQPLEGNHKFLLIKAITLFYVEVRIHYASKQLYEPKQRVRNIHTKLVIFNGQ